MIIPEIPQEIVLGLTLLGNIGKIDFGFFQFDGCVFDDCVGLSSSVLETIV